MSGGLGDNKFFRFANRVANVLIVVVGVLLFLGVSTWLTCVLLLFQWYCVLLW